MPPKRLEQCGRGHDMREGSPNVRFKKYGYRYCNQCHNERMRVYKAQNRLNTRPKAAQVPQQLEWIGPRKAVRRHRRQTLGGRAKYKINDYEYEILQWLADGLSIKEIAEKRFVTVETVERNVAVIRRKYGVTSDAAAVAQALKRGMIRPDRKAARYITSRDRIKTQVNSIKRLIRGERDQYRPHAKVRAGLLDALMSWTEPHAVSVLWAFGLITNRDVPQTRNQYRPDRSRRLSRRTAGNM